MTGRVVLVGQVVVDHVLAVPRLPEPGGEVVATTARIAVGGGASVLLAAARQGARASYAGAHGSGPWGDLIRETLARSGVAVVQPTADIDSGTCTVLVDPSGERTFVTASGAEARLDDAALDRVRAAEGDVVVVSGYALAAAGSRAAVTRWVSALPEGVLLLVDPGPLVTTVTAPVLGAALGRADWWTCNRPEAAALTDQDDLRAAALALLGRTGRAGVVVRSGPDGCVLATRAGDVERFPAPRVGVVDTTGAGDTHTGVFAAGLVSGRAAPDAARRATVAAAMSVTAPGPGTAPTLTELDAYLEGSDGSGRGKSR